MDREIAIVGTGGVGRKAHQIIADINKNPPASFEIMGYFDDDTSTHGDSIWGIEVIGGVDSISELNIANVVIGIGDPELRESVYDRLPDDINYPPIIHPSAWISDSAVISEGCIIYPKISIDNEVILGKHTQVHTNSTVGHESEIGSFCTFSSGVNLGGNVRAGDRVFFGINSAVVESISIGEDVTIGAGATVINDFSANQTVVGTPANSIDSVD